MARFSECERRLNRDFSPRHSLTRSPPQFEVGALKIQTKPIYSALHVFGAWECILFAHTSRFRSQSGFRCSLLGFDGHKGCGFRELLIISFSRSRPLARVLLSNIFSWWQIAFSTADQRQFKVIFSFGFQCTAANDAFHSVGWNSFQVSCFDRLTLLHSRTSMNFELETPHSAGLSYLTLSLPRSAFSQPFEEKRIGEVVRIAWQTSIMGSVPPASENHYPSYQNIRFPILLSGLTLKLYALFYNFRLERALKINPSLGGTWEKLLDRCVLTGMCNSPIHFSYTFHVISFLGCYAGPTPDGPSHSNSSVVPTGLEPIVAAFMV